MDGCAESSALLCCKEVEFESSVWWGVTQTVYMESCWDDAITQASGRPLPVPLGPQTRGVVFGGVLRSGLSG